MLRKLLVSAGIGLSLLGTSPAIAQETTHNQYMMRFGPSSGKLLQETQATTPEIPTQKELTIQFPDIIVESSLEPKTFRATVAGHNPSHSNLVFEFGGTYPAADSWHNYDKKAGTFAEIFYRTAAYGDFDSNNSPVKPYVKVTDLTTGKTATANFRIWIKKFPEPKGDEWTLTYPDIYATVGQEIWMPRAPNITKNGEYVNPGNDQFWLSNTPPGTTGRSGEISGTPTTVGTYDVTVTAQSSVKGLGGLKGTFKIHVQAAEPAFRYFKISKLTNTTVGPAVYISEITFIDTNGATIPKWPGADYPATSNQFLNPRNGLGNGVFTPQEVMLCMKEDCSGPASPSIEMVFDFGPAKARPKQIRIDERQPDGYIGWQPFHSTYSNNTNPFATTVWGSDDGTNWSFISSRGNTSAGSFWAVSTLYLNGFKFF